jgi:SAM-dependent methyltransferase
MSRREHWESIYRTRPDTALSWYQPQARLSLALIEQVAPGRGSALIDVGGGASVLVDGLLAAGYRNITVLDIAPAALEQARRRLGPRAECVTWLEADVLGYRFARSGYDLWHDRAVFHFLTDRDERARYRAQATRALRPGGHLILATFAPEGPERCSGLAVQRYSAVDLAAELGASFQLEEDLREEHRTPEGRMQPFVWCVFRRGEGLAPERPR